MPVSPGIYVREFDFTAYAKKLGITNLAIVGAASKGPLNTPTLITSESQLISVFGKPLLNDYGLQAAVQYLQQGDNLLFVRISHGAVQASYPIPGTSNATAATSATGTVVFTSNVNPSDGDSVSVASSVPTTALQNKTKTAGGNVAIAKSCSVAIISGMAGGSATEYATGSIKLTANPSSTNTITIGDGTLTKTFEFNNGAPSGSNIAVAIGTDPYATLANLNAAIDGALNIAATDITERMVFEFDSNSVYTAGHIPVLIGASALDTLFNFVSAVSVQSSILGVTARNTTTTVPQATLTVTAPGTVGNGPLVASGSNITATGFSGGTDGASGSISAVMNVYALNPGTWGNSIQVTTRQTTTVGAPATNFDLLVYAPVDDGSSLTLVERFTNLSLDPTSPRYAPNLITYGKRGDTIQSAYIQVDVLAGAGAVAPGSYALGASPGSAGTDGISGLVPGDYIGTVAGQASTGLQALRNPETTEFNVLIIPGVSDTTVINAALAIANKRGDFIYIVDPPFGLSRDQVIAWHNGLAPAIPGAPGAPLNSNYLALYWSWVQITDAYSQQTIWIPPSGPVAAAYAYTDRTKGPGWAPAGTGRGKISANQVEFSPDQDDRDMLVGNENRVNPLVAFVDGGVQTLAIYGNRTTQRALTSLNEVGVRRAFLYAEKLCATATRVLVFDPNDSVTWRAFTSLVNEQLAPLQNSRNIGKFIVICNEETNPPSQIQNKTMRGKIIIEALDSAEIIEQDFAIAAPNGLLTVSQQF